MFLRKISFCVIFYSWTLETKDYIVNNSKCKIPDFNPFNDDVKTIMEPADYLSCNHSELLTFVTKTNNKAILHLREDLIAKYSPNASCCYSYVQRNGSLEFPDEGISISPCEKLSGHLVLEEDIVMVRCFELSYCTTRLVYENVHYSVIKEQVPSRTKSEPNQNPSMSVLFIIVDSISRLNFIRTMPETYKYLLDNNFLEMKGYTKVADNTFPNAMAFLTGFNLRQARNVCKPGKINGLDMCPMIWYDFKKLGYITAYAEDFTTISTFNFNKKGFKNPPTTYYFKPYLEATEQLKITNVYTMPYCTGPESAGERILNLAKDFSTSFVNQSTFGVFWMNTFSHNDINAPHGMDKKLKQFFMDINSAGVLDQSMVLFLSDHGVRYGTIRTTISGWFEERMPMNMISTPKNFKKKYPQLQVNLEENANKLTSPYDLYKTLQQILTLHNSNYTKRSISCSSCSSLFEVVPTERSCLEAGIPFQWCTCKGNFHKIIDNNHELVMNVINFALQNIAYDTNECKQYYLKKISSASVSETNTLLFLVFETEPEAIFLATIKFNQVINNRSKILITRIENDNICVPNITLS